MEVVVEVERAKRFLIKRWYCRPNAAQLVGIIVAAEYARRYSVARFNLYSSHWCQTEDNRDLFPIRENYIICYRRLRSSDILKLSVGNRRLYLSKFMDRSKTCHPIADDWRIDLLDGEISSELCGERRREGDVASGTIREIGVTAAMVGIGGSVTAEIGEIGGTGGTVGMAETGRRGESESTRRFRVIKRTGGDRKTKGRRLFGQKDKGIIPILTSIQDSPIVPPRYILEIRDKKQPNRWRDYLQYDDLDFYRGFRSLFRMLDFDSLMYKESELEQR